MADVARGERLKKLREEGKHVSQATAAHEIGVSEKSVRSWEKGGGIKWKNARRAGEYYGVDPESLVTREGEDDGEVELPEAGGDPDQKLAKLLAGQARLLAEVAKVQRQLQALQGSRRRPARRKEGSGNG